MSTEHPAPEIRASDAERERVAVLIQRAGAEGRLTIAESDERLRQVYATTYRHELDALTTDLPASRTSRRSPTAPVDDRPRQGRDWSDSRNRALRIHAMAAATLSALVIVRWIASDVPYFWPMFPMFWMWLTVFIHARWRGVRTWPFGPARRPRRAGTGT